MTYIKKMQDLRLAVPRIALMTINCENSPYVSYSGNSKNCYLVCGSEYDEDCYYGFWLYDSKDCVDCDYCQKCQLCYDCVDCIESYNASHSQDCVSCVDCEYLYDCLGCQNCFGCAGLRKKKYCIGNKQYKKEEYEKIVKDLKIKNSSEKLVEMLEEMKKQVPHLYVHELNNENCNGDYVYNCKNTFACFDVKNMEDCGNCNNCVALKDCWDMSNSYYNEELNYEVMSSMNLVNCNFCVTCFDSHDLDHCEHVYNSHDCFGCFSLKHAQYCIFNKQYSKEEYFKEAERIKKEMIESAEYMQFPYSTYPYEDSNAMMEFALNNEALKEFEPGAYRNHGKLSSNQRNHEYNNIK